MRKLRYENIYAISVSVEPLREARAVSIVTLTCVTGLLVLMRNLTYHGRFRRGPGNEGTGDSGEVHILGVSNPV